MRFYPEGNLAFQLDRMLNRGLTFVDNISGALLSIELTGEEQTISHRLGRVPIGFLVLSIDGEREAPTGPNGVTSAFAFTKDPETDFLLINYEFPINTVGPYAVWAVRITEWTSEILYLRSSVRSQMARLFVL